MNEKAGNHSVLPGKPAGRMVAFSEDRKGREAL